MGFILGSIGAYFKLAKYFLSDNLNYLSKVADLYTLLFRGTPLILQLFVLKATLFSSLNSLLCAILVCGFNSGAYITEILYSSIISIDISQYETGLSLGFTELEVFKNIIMPQALKNARPTLMNEFSSLLKETSVVGMIGVYDLNTAARSIVSRSASPVAFYIAGVFYLIIVWGTTKLRDKINYKGEKIEELKHK
jgi:ABC-type amino acid transport system permease subunit